MPLYDYQCQQCSNGFIELRRMFEMEAPIEECPECGSRETLRSVSSFAVVATSSMPSVSAP